MRQKRLIISSSISMISYRNNFSYMWFLLCIYCHFQNSKHIVYLLLEESNTPMAPWNQYFHHTKEFEVKNSTLVPVSAGKGLIFFPVAGRGLCFGLGMRPVLITYWCVSCCSAPQAALSVSRWQGAQEAERGHSQDSWPQLTQGIFQTTWQCAQHIN